jgi:hypothetical protein
MLRSKEFDARSTINALKASSIVQLIIIGPSSCSATASKVSRESTFTLLRAWRPPRAETTGHRLAITCSYSASEIMG